MEPPPDVTDQVTETVREAAVPVPVAANPAIEMFTVSCVALLKVVELIEMPEPEKSTAAPLMKPVPVMTMSEVRPCARVAGEIDVTVGDGLIVKMAADVPVARSGLVTVMVPAPVGAFGATVTFAVMLVALV